MQIGKTVFGTTAKKENTPGFMAKIRDSFLILISAKDAAIQSGERVETSAFVAARAEIFRESRAYMALMEQCQNITAETDPGLFWALEILRNTK